MQLEEELKRHRKLIYVNVGDSMEPFIRQGRDLLVIERPEWWDGLPEGSRTNKLRKYDVPLFKRDDGRAYVLHRVLKVRDEEYVICGDNRRCREYGICDRHVSGVLTAVIRNGKEVSVTNPLYRFRVHLWCDLFYVRAGILSIRDFSKFVRVSIRRVIG